MIKKLRARYEGHADTVIELSPGFNTLLGDNDHGKSSISRSIRWVAENQPRGDEMIPWSGKKEAIVTITTEQSEVTRRKGPSNEYRVDGDTFKAVSNLVPEEVEKALNIDSTNIQTQVDQFFLLTATPGAVAKRINEVAGIADSDAAIKRTNELISDTNGEIKKLKEERKRGQEYLDAYDSMISEAVDLYQAMSEIFAEIDRLGTRLQGMTVLQNTIAASRLRLEDFPDFPILDQKIGDIHGLEGEVEKQTEFHRNATALSVLLHSVDLRRFDFIDSVDLEAVRQAYRENYLLGQRLAGMIQMEEQISGIDLDRFDGVDEDEVDVTNIKKLKADVDSWAEALRLAERMSREIHEFDNPAWSVLDEIDLDRIKKLHDEVISDQKKAVLIGDIIVAEVKVQRYEDELKEIAEEADAAGLVCGECGQLLKGESIWDR